MMQRGRSNLRSEIGKPASSKRMYLAKIKRFMEKRDLMDTPSTCARDNVKDRLHRVLWAESMIVVFTCGGFFADWGKLGFLYGVFVICASFTYVALAYEIFMAWRIKDWFERTGSRSFEELSKSFA
jgi:hypothetical protein